MDALTGSAERYGRALLEMAVEQGELQTVTRDLELARRVFDEPELMAFIGNPAVPGQAKLELLDRLLAARISQILLVFLKVVVNRRRERQLSGIIRAAHYLCLARLGFEVVFLTTPYPLEDDLKQAVRERLEAVLGSKLPSRIPREQEPHRGHRHPSQRRSFGCQRPRYAAPHPGDAGDAAAWWTACKPGLR